LEDLNKQKMIWVLKQAGISILIVVGLLSFSVFALWFSYRFVPMLDRKYWVRFYLPQGGSIELYAGELVMIGVQLAVIVFLFLVIVQRIKKREEST